jgi:hypothetical protein
MCIDVQKASNRMTVHGHEANHTMITNAHADQASSFSLTIETKLIFIAFLVGLFGRLTYGWHTPLWLDETYSATIASQTSISGLWQWCVEELSGPIYYSLLFLWEKLAGNGDTALRIPSLLASIAAILVMAKAKILDRRERLIWAALGAVWLPQMIYASQARPQALLFLFATGQAVLFLRCVNTLNNRNLLCWVALSVAMLMTHMHSIFISGLQSLMLLIFCGSSLWRHKYAFAPALIPAIWFPFQLPFLQTFMQPSVTWYPILSPNYLLFVPTDMFGDHITSYMLFAVLTGILAMQLWQRYFGHKPLPYSKAEGALILSGLFAFFAMIVIGMVKPFYWPRYTVPFMPAILLGVTLTVVRLRMMHNALPSLVLVLWIAAFLTKSIALFGPKAQSDLNNYGFQHSADWLMANKARRVILIWNNPTSRLSKAARQNEMAGFFFRRANYDVSVTAARLPYIIDSSESWAKLARDTNSAIMLIDTGVGRIYLTETPGFKCKYFSGIDSPAVACLAPVAAHSEH